MHPIGREPTARDWARALGPGAMCLPDGEATGTSVTGWSAAMHALIEAGWSVQWCRGDVTESALPAQKLFECRNGEDVGRVVLRSPGRGMVVHLWPYQPTSFLFDFDIRELQSAGDWEPLNRFIRTVCAALERDVTLRHEGSEEVFAVLDSASHSWRLAVAPVAD